jgi:hypothetical protein
MESNTMSSIKRKSFWVSRESLLAVFNNLEN